MEYSERHLARAAHSGGSHEVQIATRLLEDVNMYRRWELSHAHMMQSVAEAPRVSAQTLQLRRVAFTNLHRKAPFEYLRERRVSRGDRHHMISALFGEQDYASCIVREHWAYLSASASLMCTDSLCSDVLHDVMFSDALSAYDSAYGEYYRAYGDSLLAERQGEESTMKSLLPYLRFQLKIIREHILSGASPKSDFAELQKLFEATGDTQRLPILRRM